MVFTCTLNVKSEDISKTSKSRRVDADCKL